jgi:cytochrome c oxidase cbb3-type subunit 3
MAVEERDPYTGHLTTGHEWNGIKELNTRVPMAIWFFIIVTHVWALIYWILMPSWPLIWTYTKGLLETDQRKVVAEQLEDANAQRATWMRKIDAESFRAILADNNLMRNVRETGHRLFGDNCAACHGSNAQGRTGYPNLVSKSLLWGDDPTAIAETIRIGINSGHQEARSSQMPAFGRDKMLSRDEIEHVVTYVLSLSGREPAEAKAGEIAAGEAVFAANCAACHGEKGTGNIEMGSRNLTDLSWLYGGDRKTIFETVWNGRQGQMPTWEGRLSPVQRKILALYIADLRAPKQ